MVVHLSLFPSDVGGGGGVANGWEARGRSKCLSCWLVGGESFGEKVEFLIPAE